MPQPTDTTESRSDRVIERRPAETPSTAVIEAVAELLDQSPVEMKPLSEAVDPVALDALLTPVDGNASSVTATFDYCGCHVLVTPSEIHIDL